MSILDRAKEVLDKSKIRKVGIRGGDEPTETEVRTDEFGRLRKLHIPIKEQPPEPTELALDLKDDPNVLVALRNYVRWYLYKFDCLLWTDENDRYWFNWKKENCNFKIVPTQNWKLEFYSKSNDLYYDIYDLIYSTIKFNFIKDVIDFNHFLMTKTIGERKNLFPVGLWNEKNNFFYLNPWKLSGLKEYFDLWNKSKKKMYWAYFERLFKTLKAKPEFNREKIKIKYFLCPYEFGFLSIGNLLNKNEEDQIKNEINLFLEKIKMSFWTYREHKEQLQDYENRKNKIGF